MASIELMIKFSGADVDLREYFLVGGWVKMIIDLMNRWIKELSEAGFSGAEAIVYDNDLPYHRNATIIASPLSTTTTTATNQKKISILRNSAICPVADHLARSLQNGGYLVDFCLLSESPKPNQDIVSVIDFEGKAFLENISAENFDALKAFIITLKSAGILWLTKPCQIEPSEPQYAQILGLARVLRNELSVDFATLEIDKIQINTTFDRVLDVLVKFQSRSREHEVDPEFEYAIRDGVVHIPRFHWISIPEEVRSAASYEGPKRLNIGKKGSLKTLHWAQGKEIEVKDDEVSLDVRAVGMNFKDILYAMGIIEEDKAQHSSLGAECAGIITKVGSNVINLNVGDRVLAFNDNSFSTRIKTTPDLCAKIPDTLSFEDAATMPCVYSTVIYGLQDMARLEAGQTVLIHSACGGIGIAAIQICRMIGAEIYATVGNEEKVKYLVERYDIPRSHIFNSRSASFLPDLMRETNGRGVDVVLNSLSGDLLHSSWACVAEYGKMVEIGKRDLIGQGRLSMDPFTANRSFFGVDLARICAERPLIVKRLLKDCMQYFCEGSIQPIRPVKFFEAIQIEEAFRFMQKGQHIGKIVISMPADSRQLATSNTHSQFSLRSDVSYLLVGGLGGLGQSISTWMVENGAKHLIYLSRSGGKRDEDVSLVTELNAQGCTVQIIAGSVAIPADIQRVISEAQLPIAGIIQMSMVLRDGGYAQMTHKAWEVAQAPKVLGTWNLHNAFDSVPLDFFVLFSSVACQWGQSGQSNYCSAGTFLDAFNQYRHGKGLPASVIDVGVVEDVGYLCENPAILHQFKTNGVQTLREYDLLETLELAIIKSKSTSQAYSFFGDGYASESHIGCGYKMSMAVPADNNRKFWKRDIRMSIYRNLHNSNFDDDTGNHEELKDFLATVSNNPQTLKESPTAKFLAEEIGKTLYNFMMRPIAELDIHQSFKTLGVDSLVAIELRNWCRQRMGVGLTVLEIMGAASIESLGQMATNELLAKTVFVEAEKST
ncbi:hypothetical protein BGAL_0036g00320 [Botrytis galanthina]|uniref:Carrier domain-containing protein n=1 Tax=Botrytis galanthina TaxID=278940 RepID=A0A4S8R7Q0_9HELO|nr:hypothetical protein BGAL_0036g00320 [Botrytis galanthina]